MTGSSARAKARHPERQPRDLNARPKQSFCTRHCLTPHSAHSYSRATTFPPTISRKATQERLTCWLDTPNDTHTYVYGELAVRTNIELDEALVQAAFRYAGVKTKRELVDLALREFVENHQRKDLRELKGRVGIRPDYDYKALRQGKSRG